MNRTGKRSRLKIVIFLAILVLAGALGYGFSLLSEINQSPVVIDGDEAKKPEDLGISDDALKKDNGVVNILLLGIDRQSRNERGRSDTMIIASVDRTNGEIKLTSLMRDMYLTIPGKQDNRINASYALGGPGLAIKTVNTNFAMNIEHYIAIDFWGFEEIVDLVGGIELDLTSGESRIVGVGGSGRHLLNGSQVLAYTRIRRIGSDFQRTERQRTVLNEFFKKAKDISMFKGVELLRAGLPHVETNLSKAELVRLGIDVWSFKELQEFRLPADKTYKNQNIRGMAVLVGDMAKNKSLLHEFIYGAN